MVADADPVEASNRVERNSMSRNSFGALLFLGIVTLGVYFLIYQYQTFGRIHQAVGLRHPAHWFWAWIGFFVASEVVPAHLGALASVLAVLALGQYLSSAADALRVRTARAPSVRTVWMVIFVPLVVWAAAGWLLLVAEVGGRAVAFLAYGVVLFTQFGFWQIMVAAVHDFWIVAPEISGSFVGARAGSDGFVE